MGCPALELADHWVELGLSIEMESSGRALTDWYYVRPSLVVQCPELGSPTSEAQGWHQARAPRSCQLQGRDRIKCWKSPAFSSVQETLFFCVVTVLETHDWMFSTAIPLSFGVSSGAGGVDRSSRRPRVIPSHLCLAWKVSYQLFQAGKPHEREERTSSVTNQVWLSKAQHTWLLRCWSLQQREFSWGVVGRVILVLVFDLLISQWISLQYLHETSWSI